MQLLKSDIYNRLIITEDTELLATAKSTITVLPPAKFILSGILEKILNIEAGATTIIHGEVWGNVFNNGGTLEVFGVIKGELYRGKGSKNMIDFDSQICGKIFKG